MSTDGTAESPEDLRVEQAVALWAKSPKLTCEQVMLASRFTAEDAKDRKKQAWIRRRAPLKKASKKPSSVELMKSPASDMSSLTQYSEGTAAAAAPKHPRPKENPKRKKPQDLQDERVAKKKDWEHRKKAHKFSTSWYKKEKEKENGMSAEDISKAVEKDYEWAPSARVIQRYVADGMAGCSPMKRGANGELPPTVFKTLCVAFETMVKINQCNGRECENMQRKLMMRTNCCVNKDGSTSLSLVKRLINETAVDILRSSKSNKAEHRRILWTTYNNIKIWFDNWETDLLELGFAEKDEKGDVYIPKEQLERILNMDETCLSMDGSDGSRGGRPVAIFYDPNLPRVGIATSKSAKTTTMITGSTAAGEALPPHFQFQTSAQTDERKKLNTAMLEWMPDVMGKFGTDKRQDWPITFGLNEKGGMDDEEFEEYVIHSICILYPDAADVKGRRVMIKADSGPGRTNKRLLARLRLLGFILYPGVPNTTAVTQETDRNYGPFKTQFRKNLDNVIQERIAKDKSTSLVPWMVGLIVFGGIDPETGLELTEAESAFEVAFSIAACVRAWEKVGAAPLTRKCLEDKKVRRELGDAEDDQNAIMAALEEANHTAVEFLNRRGYQGDKMKLIVNRVPKKKPVTAPHTVARQLLLSKASTHGAKFHATGGSHVTSHDMFKALEIPLVQKKIKAMSDDKNSRLAAEDIEKEARGVLAQAKGPETFSGPELTILMKWHHIPMPPGFNKPQKLAKWNEILASQTTGSPILPPPYTKWTEADEDELEKLKKLEIDIKDTELGRHAEMKRREMFASLPTMSKEERDRLQKELDSFKESGPE